MNCRNSEFDLNALNHVAEEADIEPEIDLLDPAQQDWRDAIRISAAVRKTYLGTSMEQTIVYIQRDFRSYGMELIHLAEFITPLWDTLVC